MPPVRRSTAKRLLKPAAQALVLDMIRDGAKVRNAMAAAGRSEALYRDWMTEPAFRDQVRLIRHITGDKKDRRPPVPDFPEFCARYLHQPLPQQHLRIWDVLNGRAPREMHPSIRYHRGRPNYLLSNMPPEHAKTEVWTVQYPVWRLHRDPDDKIVLISKSQTMAKRYLHAIKQRLTGPRWTEMQVKFAPSDGWRDPDGSWTKTEIYVAGKDDGAKDPTVQALGWTGHIQGSRARLIVIDDMQDLKAAGQWPAMMDYISQDVDSRLSDDGQLLYNQTRVGAEDVSKHLRDDLVDFDGTPVFTYLAQPAVLDYADTSQQWITLWPEKWDGPKLAKKRAMMRDERRWALVYQQADVDEDAVFPPQALQCAVNRTRPPGAMADGFPSGRSGGMQGLYVIGGLDPATVGHTAALVIGVDRATKTRYLLDGFDKANCSPREMIQRVQELTTRLGVKTWVVERNAFQRFLTQLDEFRNWMYSRHVRLREHVTGDNKYDDQFGVAAMAGLFLSCGTPRNDGSGEWTRTPDTALIELPTPRLSRVTSLLIEQLATWHPTDMRQRAVQDLVMALWFCEIEARSWLGVGRTAQNYATSQGATRHDLANRRVVNLNELAALREAERRGA
jgi:hypothetical protein